MRRAILSTGLALSLMFTTGLAVQAQPAATPAAAQKAAPSARSLELARRYFKALKLAELVGGMMDDMDPLMALGESDVDAEDRALMGASVKEAFVAQMPAYVDALVPVMAEIFTEEELEAMVTFYESPVGQSAMAKTSQVNQQTVGIILKMMPSIMEDAMERYCSKTTCSDELREKIKKMES